jgi:hypothetical protein
MDPIAAIDGDAFISHDLGKVSAGPEVSFHLEGGSSVEPSTLNGLV